MTPDLPMSLVREGYLLLATTGGPILIALAGVGLVVGVLQAATQVNDPAVGFVPRLFAAVAVCWATGPWLVERFAAFFRDAVLRMAGG